MVSQTLRAKCAAGIGRSSSPDTSLPPGPGASPLAQTLAFFYEPRAFLEAIHEVNGPVATLRFGPTPTVHIHRPEHVEPIFKGPIKELHSSARAFVPFVGEYSLFVLDEDEHMEQRRLLNPSFRRERMIAYGDVMRDETRRAFARIPDGEVVRMEDISLDLTLQIMARTVFGVDADEQRELVDLLATARKGLSQPLNFVPAFQRDLGPLSPWGRYLRRRARLHELLEDEIHRRRSMDLSGREDVLSMLVQATHTDGEPMGVGEIRDQMKTMLVAGHETTSAALDWVFYCIARYDDVRARLLEELDQAFPEGAIEGSRVLRLEYLTGVIKESMRLYPITLGASRLLQAPREVAGWQVPAGSVVACSSLLAHMDPESWPEPERFSPERFIGTKTNPYRYFPFGGGVRRCIGEAFALYEMRIAVATVLSERIPRLVPRAKYRAARTGFTIGEKSGMPLIFERRSSERPTP